MRITKSTNLVFLFSLCSSVALRGELVITAEVLGSNVVVEGTGSLDISGLTPSGGPYSSSGRGFYPTNSVVRVGSIDTGNILLYTGFTSAPGDLGPGGFTVASSGAGQLFAVNASYLRLDATYNSGDPISTSNVFENVDLVGLGLDPGTYTWEWSSDSLTLIVKGDAPISWHGYTVLADGWVDTGSWLGWLNIERDPYIWVLSLNKYIYLSDDSGWVYIPK